MIKVKEREMKRIKKSSFIYSVYNYGRNQRGIIFKITHCLLNYKTKCLTSILQLKEAVEIPCCEVLIIFPNDLFGIPKSNFALNLFLNILTTLPMKVAIVIKEEIDTRVNYKYNPSINSLHS